MSKEIWKDIPNYEGLYQVSNLGRILRIGRKTKLFGERNYKYKDLIKKPQKTTFGYYKIHLTKEGKQRTFIIHRLVAICFIDNPGNKPQVNHIDGVKTNNKVENLEWCTSSENNLHAFKNGLKKPIQGTKHGQCKLTESEILEIRAIGKSKTLNEIAEIYNINFRHVSQIINRKRWKHI